MLGSVTRGPRQRPVVLLNQASEACGDLIGTGDEDPILVLSLQLSSQAELQLLQPLDDLRLEAIQFGQVQVNILAVQLPQSSDHLVQLLLVQILLLENTLQLDRFLDALAGLASELPDVSPGETPARVSAA